MSSLRWLKLDVPATVTRGTWVEKRDLSKVDEIGWAQLMPGSGHGVGGFVGVSKFEVWGKPVPRMFRPRVERRGRYRAEATSNALRASATSQLGRCNPAAQLRIIVIGASRSLRGGRR